MSIPIKGMERIIEGKLVTIWHRDHYGLVGRAIEVRESTAIVKPIGLDYHVEIDLDLVTPGWSLDDELQYIPEAKR